MWLFQSFALVGAAEKNVVQDVQKEILAALYDIRDSLHQDFDSLKVSASLMTALFVGYTIVTGDR